MKTTITTAVLVSLCVSTVAGERQTRYSNEDLERIAPRRGETGATTASVAAPDPARDRGRGTGGSRATAAESPGRDEAWWRAEAEKSRRRVAVLRARSVELEARAAEAAVELTRAPRNQRARLEARAQIADAAVRKMRALIRDEELGLHDRARVAGALPGWIR